MVNAVKKIYIADSKLMFMHIMSMFSGCHIQLKLRMVKDSRHIFCVVQRMFGQYNAFHNCIESYPLLTRSYSFQSHSSYRMYAEIALPRLYDF